MQWLDSAPDGVRLSVTTPQEEVEAAARDAKVIVLEFDAFRDGRGFSLAAVLRERGFRGQLVAAGRLIADQARHLRRSGFDAVVLEEGADVAAWKRMDEAFSAVYQPAIDAGVPVWRRRAEQRRQQFDPEALAERLNRETRGADAEALLRAALDPAIGLKPVALSSFGAEAAVLLSVIARVSPDLPIIFLDTGMHFLQTIAYRDALAKQLGLTNIRIVTPEPQERAALDPADGLWRTNPDGCCELRKVRPMERAIEGANALITGRKRHQTAHRAELEPFEAFEGRVRINPLHDWSAEQLQAWIEAHDLPRHPLSTHGYRSIGCWPCTRAVDVGEDARGGRWSGAAKTECGIHLGRRTLVAG